MALSPLIRTGIDTVCRISYELALLLVLVVVALTPAHQAATLHFNVDRTLSIMLSDSRILFRTDRAGLVKSGDVLPVYRFYSNWKTELGRVTVDEVNGDEVIASYESDSFRWPMGRHARIISESNTK